MNKLIVLFALGFLFASANAFTLDDWREFAQGVAIGMGMKPVPPKTDLDTRVLYRRIQVLQLYASKFTSNQRRIDPTSQIASRDTAVPRPLHPAQITCLNVEDDDHRRVRWECHASDLDTRVELSDVTIQCEGWRDSKDHYIRQGSCHADYTLKYTDAAISAMIGELEALRVSPKNETVGVMMIFIQAVGITAAVFLSVGIVLLLFYIFEHDIIRFFMALAQYAASTRAFACIRAASTRAFACIHAHRAASLAKSIEATPAVDNLDTDSTPAIHATMPAHVAKSLAKSIDDSVPATTPPPTVADPEPESPPIVCSLCRQVHANVPPLPVQLVSK